MMRKATLIIEVIIIVGPVIGLYFVLLAYLPIYEPLPTTHSYYNLIICFPSVRQVPLVATF